MQARRQTRVGYLKLRVEHRKYILTVQNCSQTNRTRRFKPLGMH